MFGLLVVAGAMLMRSMTVGRHVADVDAKSEKVG
jgi:hypothetical protein